VWTDAIIAQIAICEYRLSDTHAEKGVGLCLSPTAGHHRPSDIGPFADSDSGIDIGRGRMPTHDTRELSLRASVGLLAVAADRTGTARVARVDRHNRHPGPARLVADELPQLRTGPVVVSRPLLPPLSPRPLANVRQFLQRNRPLRAFGPGNKPLADAVVRILLKARGPRILR